MRRAALPWALGLLLLGGQPGAGADHDAACDDLPAEPDGRHLVAQPARVFRSAVDYPTVYVVKFVIENTAAAADTLWLSSCSNGYTGSGHLFLPRIDISAGGRAEVEVTVPDDLVAFGERQTLLAVRSTLDPSAALMLHATVRQAGSCDPLVPAAPTPAASVLVPTPCGGGWHLGPGTPVGGTVDPRPSDTTDARPHAFWLLGSQLAYGLAFTQTTFAATFSFDWLPPAATVEAELGVFDRTSGAFIVVASGSMERPVSLSGAAELEVPMELDPVFLRIEPHPDRDLHLRVKAVPGAGNLLAAGTSLRLPLTEHHDRFAPERFNLPIVHPVRDFGWDLANVIVRVGENSTFEVPLHNEGAVDAPLRLSASVPEVAHWFVLPDARLPVGAERLTVRVEAPADEASVPSFVRAAAWGDGLALDLVVTDSTGHRAEMPILLHLEAAEPGPLGESEAPWPALPGASLLLAVAAALRRWSPGGPSHRPQA